MLLVLNLPLAPLWVRLLMIPRPLLYGSILVFALLGAYAANGSVVDVVFLVVIGLIGYAMRVFDFPVAPVLVGMILGPLSEQQLRRALAISQGSPVVFLTRPVAAALLLIVIGILIVPPLVRRLRAH